MPYLKIVADWKPNTNVAALILSLVVASLMVVWRHVGFQASDDADYLSGGLGWLAHFPYVGNSHWSLRHTITLPIAGSVSVLGLSEFSAVLPTAAYFIGYMSITIWASSRFIGLIPALVGTLLMSTMPGSVVVATYINADMAELFYITVAFWAFVYALDQPKRKAPLITCGVAAALALLTRETSAAFVGFAGLMFLFHPIMPRKNYLIIAISFAAIVGFEWAYLTIMTGDPFYRIEIDQHHDIIDRASEAAHTSARNSVIDAEGALSLKEWWLNPILNLFVSQKYGLLFWGALPSAVLLLKSRAKGSTRLPIVPIMLVFAAVWYVFVGFNPKLYFVPRYLLVLSSIMSLIVGSWLVEQWRMRRRFTAGIIAIAMIGVNLAGLLVENTNPTFGERSLASFAAGHPGERIDTDPATLRRASYFFRFQGIDFGNIYTADPSLNALVFYNPNAIERCSDSARCKIDNSAFMPRPNWVEISRMQPSRGTVAELIEMLGVGQDLPADLAHKLMQPIAPVILYRVTAADGADH
jgi:hypothetical protein